jgi:hypothetical protein
LLSDTSLSHYRIDVRLGAGGMGEVYRATDTKLGREVAIKVLPAELAQDPERLARFEREAKLLASLNHPNIAHVYGFERAALADGSTTHFLNDRHLDRQAQLPRSPRAPARAALRTPRADEAHIRLRRDVASRWLLRLSPTARARCLSPAGPA